MEAVGIIGIDFAVQHVLSDIALNVCNFLRVLRNSGKRADYLSCAWGIRSQDLIGVLRRGLGKVDLISRYPLGNHASHRTRINLAASIRVVRIMGNLKPLFNFLCTQMSWKTIAHNLDLDARFRLSKFSSELVLGK